jgi:hypothetical protein
MAFLFVPRTMLAAEWVSIIVLKAFWAKAAPLMSFGAR